MFIGREYEINKLDALYKSDKFELVIIYGRRRVGKTTLISNFCNDKESIFYVGEELNNELSLQKFTNVVTKHWNENQYINKFNNWENAFRYVLDKSDNKRTVLVIDEFPYIAGVNRSIMSTLQNLIDHSLKDSKLFIILCGSSISFMENDVLGYKSPLFGRRTAQLEIKPLDFFDMIKMFKDYSEEEQIKLYSIIGGTPHYMNLMKGEKSFRENVIKNVLDKGSYIYREPINLLKQELREPYLYNSIIQAIGTGSTKLNEIALKIAEKTDKTSNYIRVLCDLKIVEKIRPITDKENSKKTLYRLSDNLFKFYYKYISQNEDLIEQDLVEYLFDEEINKNFSEYLGFIYEDICMQYLKRLNKEMKLPFVVSKFGKWWGNNPAKKIEEEIDIVAVNKDSAIVVECKYKNSKVGTDVLDRLMEKSILLPQKNKFYFIFSKSGFDDKLIEISKKSENIYLFRDLTINNSTSDVN